MISKLLPVITLIGGGVANHKTIENQLQKIFGITQATAVQVELDDIAKMIYLDRLDDSAPKTQEEFIDYVRRNMRNKVGQNRDTSKDFWGTEYRYQLAPTEFKVSSAGPDKQFDTPDDIVTGYKL